MIGGYACASSKCVCVIEIEKKKKISSYLQIKNGKIVRSK